MKCKEFQPAVITNTEENANTQNKVFNPIKYLEKYLYVLNEDIKIDNCNNKKFEKPIIWQMWWQGIENAPDIVKICFERTKELYPENQIIITKDNHSDYIEIPKFILDKYEQKIISNAHFSDIVRLLLLYSYGGGGWIDSTCLLASKIPDEIVSSDLFYFKSRIWGEWSKVPSKKTLERLVENLSIFEGYITGSNWFIVSKPHNYVLGKLTQMLIEYWKNESALVDYFIFHYFISLIIINDKKARQIYNSMINKNNVVPHILQGQFAFDFDNEIYDEIKDLSFIHKLTYYANIEAAAKNENSFYNQIIKMYKTKSPLLTAKN